MKPVSKFPAAIYRSTVLERIFTDAKRLFLSSMLEIDYAHLVMLVEQGIVSPPVAAECFRALDKLDRDEVLAETYDGTFEDLFFLVEQKLAQLCGVENAGWIHTARSRNDIDMTMYRMVLRKRLLETLEAVILLRDRLLELAEEHRDSLMPAYTHNQPAQPTTLGHYLTAFIEILERDSERLIAAYNRVNHCPLGACAITTTGFPINRERTAHLLGFDGIQNNSYGSIAAVDYVTESCAAVAVMMLSVGRFSQDLLLWSTAEFGYIRLSDGYVQISSIMPQKRNPVPLEHVRILASRAFTSSQAVLGSLHNTPFADMNDSEDPMQPLVDGVFNDCTHALQLLEGLLSEATFNTELMHLRAQGSFLTVTELADTLVRSASVSFHQAHKVVGTAVRELAGNFDRETMIEKVTGLLTQMNVTPPEHAVLSRALDAENFVAVRTIQGGPAPHMLDQAFAASKARSSNHRQFLTDARKMIQAATEETHRVSQTMQ